MESDAYTNERLGLGLMYTMDPIRDNCKTAVKYLKRTCEEEYNNMVTANLDRTKNTLAKLDGKPDKISIANKMIHEHYQTSLTKCGVHTLV